MSYSATSYKIDAGCSSRCQRTRTTRADNRLSGWQIKTFAMAISTLSYRCQGRIGQRYLPKLLTPRSCSGRTTDKRPACGNGDGEFWSPGRLWEIGPRGPRFRRWNPLLIQSRPARFRSSRGYPRKQPTEANWDASAPGQRTSLHQPKRDGPVGGLQNLDRLF